jgi:hypothetical protein
MVFACSLVVCAAAISLAAHLVHAQAARSNAHKAAAVPEVLLRVHLVHAHLRGGSCEHGTSKWLSGRATLVMWRVVAIDRVRHGVLSAANSAEVWNHL